MTRDDDARVADLIGRLGDRDNKDLFRRLLEQGMQDLIDAELTTVIGAEPHERTDSRSNQCNGARPRLLSTPADDIELRIPKLRVGSFYPSLLEPCPSLHQTQGDSIRGGRPALRSSSPASGLKPEASYSQ